MVEKNVRWWVMSILKTYWRRITAIIMVSAIVAITEIIFPIVWQRVIDTTVAGIFDWRLVAILIAFMAVQSIPLATLLRERLMNRCRYDSRDQMFRHLLHLSIPFYAARKSNTVVEQTRKGIESGAQLVRRFLNAQLLTDIPVAIFALGYVTLQSPAAGAALVGFTICFALLGRIVGQRSMRTQEQREEIDTELKGWLREVFAFITAVKLFRAEGRELGELASRGEALLKLENQQDLLDSFLDCLGQVSHALPFGLALALFLPHVANGTMTIGTMFALVMYAGRAVGPLGYLAAIYQEMAIDLARLKPALKLLSARPSILEAERPVDMLPLRHELALRNVSFAYPKGHGDAITDISFTIPAGKKTAIVGESGAGKSTIAKLLARFYDPDHGVITVDGTDLRQLSFATLYEQVCLVTQEVTIFSGTIAENVSYGFESEEPRLHDACRRASADFIFELPDGLHSQIGESGLRLSGGQRQRIALARVLLREPSIIILDEATAALDQATERDIQHTFAQLLQMNGGTTMVVIAHRMSTVRRADQIVVLDKGRVVATGTHDELIKSCPKYQALCLELSH